MSGGGPSFLYTLKPSDFTGANDSWQPVAAFGFAGNPINVDGGQRTRPVFADSAPMSLLGVAAVGYVNVGADPAQPSLNYQLQQTRGARVFNTLRTAVVGPTDIWTPSTGNTFVVMGLLLSVSGVITGTGTLQLELRDNALAFFKANATCADPLTGDTQIAADFGQGFQSAAADNVLRIALTPALDSGQVAVNVWGLEIPPPPP